MDNNEFKPVELLEKVLAASKEIAEQGKNYAEDALNIPDSGVERENKLDGLKKGAFATAVLFGLLGTKGGRSITGKAIKIGGVAALGAAAYKGYKYWRNHHGGIAVHQLKGIEAQDRAFLLIAAMVSAARADGKLDDDESALLKREILEMNLSKDLFDQLAQVVDNPLTAAELSARVSDDAIASEVYLAARIFIDDDSSESELAYLKDLVGGLGINQDLVAALDAELV